MSLVRNNFIKNLFTTKSSEYRSLLHKLQTSNLLSEQFTKSVSRRKIFLYKLVPSFLSNVLLESLFHVSCKLVNKENYIICYAYTSVQSVIYL